MKNTITAFITLTIAAALTGCCNSNESRHYSIEKVYRMPSCEEGFEQGVSACYAATYGNALFIAGGCNFPNVPAAEGGEKVYYRGIYRMTTATGEKWEKVGELPEPSAYGATLQAGNNWYIIGGMNSKGSQKSVYRIDLETFETMQMPHLPCTIDNATAAADGSTLYIIGGNADGKASNRAFALDLNSNTPEWSEITAMPGMPRVQPVCAAAGGKIYVWGGFAPSHSSSEAAVHCDGLVYDPAGSQWESIGEITGNAGIMTLSGGTAIVIDNNSIIATGGVNKDIFLDAISGRYELTGKEEYMYKPAEWYSFNKELLLFDTNSRCWQSIGTDSRYARAGAQLVKQGERLFIIGGELKPGIRTPEIYLLETTD